MGTITAEQTTSLTPTWPVLHGWVPVDQETVDRVVAIPDPAVRNLWITTSYADFAHRLLPFLGDDQTWCTFAIWASNTVGVSIRQEEIPEALDELLGEAPHHIRAISAAADDHHRLIAWLVKPFEATHLDRLVRRAIDQVSEHMAHGNTIVYAQLAPLFVALIEHLEQHGAPEPTDIDAALDAIGAPSMRDQPLLNRAFSCYLHAAGTNGRERAQLVLAANIAAVLHEQQRLQPDLVAALDSALLDMGDDINNLISRFVPGFARQPIVRAVEARVAAPVKAMWAHIATKFTMTLDVPGQTLHLDVDVPPPVGRSLFTAPLVTLDQPCLLKLMREWDPTDGTGIGSAAYDWSRLHDRMGYIVNLFRSRQQMTELTALPFSHEQLMAMAAGHLPAGL